jgi:predicted enzyme related to lactoylglutathione lyase
MPHLIGPDFIGIQAEDIEAARTFYTEVVGLKAAPHGPPGAVVFDTKPVPFAVRKPLVDLEATDKLGWGIAIWFGCDDADALHDHLVKHGTPIVFAPKDGPFGRYFAFRDPFGYTITPHTADQSPA